MVVRFVMMKSFSWSSGWQRLLGQWLPLLLWMAIIFVVSHRSSGDLPDFGFWDSLVKKSGHFLAYSVLAGLAYRTTAETRRPFVWAMVITAVYAASDEFHQSFVNDRSGNVMDVLLDCVGGATALYLIWRSQGTVEEPIKEEIREGKEYRHSQ